MSDNKASGRDLKEIVSALIEKTDDLKRNINDNPENLMKIVQQIRDIAEELKKSGNELLFEEQLLRTLMENIPDSIFFKDTESRFVRVSNAWADRRKLSAPEETIGKTDFDFFPLQHAQEAFNDENKIIRTGIPIVGKVECETALDDESERWV